MSQILTYERIITPSDHPLRGVITPETAERLMRLNASNRSISAKQVELYKREMERGVFAYTGDPIRFDVNGKLIDGQHRLVAAINAKTPFETLVINGLPSEVMSVIDTGRKRSASDQLSLNGIANASNVVSAVNAVYALAAERTSISVATIEVEQFVRDYPQILESVVKVQHTGARDRCGAPAVLAAIHFLGTVMLDEPKISDEFVHVFATGAQFYPNDAAFAYREYYINNQTRWSKTSLKVTTIRGFLLRAFNEFRKRKPGSKRPPRNPVEVRFDDFDATKIGLGHIRNRTPLSIERFISEADKDERNRAMRQNRQRQREDKKRSLLPLAVAPNPAALTEDTSPTDDRYDFSTIRLRKRDGETWAEPA